jgi:signal transduction histidine kinase
MSLTLQFALISILPLSFIGMIVYLWFKGGKRRKVLIRWTFVLLALAVWASSVLRFYATIDFTTYKIFYSWGILGIHAFSFAALCLLMTTARYMFVPSGSGRGAIFVSGILWLLAIGLDQTIWPYIIPNFPLAGQNIRHFDIWAAVWIASWLVPVIASWMLTQQVNRSLPRSLYRNQIRYWLLVLTIFGIGGILASIQQPGQPIWQEIAVLIVLLAGIIGTISLTHGQLPDIQLATRQLLYRLSGTLIIFGLTWLALSLIVRGLLPNLPAETDPNLVLILIAAVFAALFMIINRLVNNLMKRIFLPSKAKQEAALADYTNAVGNFPDPEQLGHLILRYVQSSLGVDDVWMMTAEDGAGGLLILRPLSHLNNTDSVKPVTAVFAANSPFTAHLRQKHTPLIQYDIDALETYDLLPQEERHVLEKWQRVLFMPLHTGNSLLGVLALNQKTSGESYERKDFEQLENLDEHVSPIFAQVMNLAALQRINDYVFSQNRILIREKQYLQEFVKLYDQYVNLISPELRRPFAAIDDQIMDLQTSVATDKNLQEKVARLNQLIVEGKNPVDNLINLASRVQMRREFHFQLLQIDDIIQDAMRDLRNMAEARRVTIEFTPKNELSPIFGDSEQLQEAIKGILHNAIKFNKIGGHITINSDTTGGKIVVQVKDTGVGISSERMESIWQGFTPVQGNGSGKKRPGMGLVLSKFIVEAHGGHVTVESNYGSGSTFSIYLPLVFDE